LKELTDGVGEVMISSGRFKFQISVTGTLLHKEYSLTSPANGSDD